MLADMWKTIAFRSAVLLLSGVLINACTGRTANTSYWTNFEWEQRSDGSMLSLADSTILSPLPGYEAIVLAADTYYYVANTEDFGIAMQRVGEDKSMRANGHIEFGEEGYFRYRNNWSEKERKWKVAAARLGGEGEIQGDCIGYDGRVLMVQEGDSRRYYDYALSPITPTVELDCEIYPPPPPRPPRE